MNKFYNETGWADNVSTFSTAHESPQNNPNWTEMPNGLWIYEFSNNDYLNMKSFHINHDVKPNGQSHMHIHFAPTANMAAGQTLTWELQYAIANGYHQGSFINGTTTTLNLVYTADGTEQAGEHLILEDATGFTTPEPDSIVLVKATYKTGTYTGSVYGIMCDLHYQVDRNCTPSKEPDFYS